MGGLPGGMAPALELGTTPGTGTAIKPSCCFPDQPCKTVIQKANTVDIGTFAVFLNESCLDTRSFALSSRGTSFDVSQ